MGVVFSQKAAKQPSQGWVDSGAGIPCGPDSRAGFLVARHASSTSFSIPCQRATRSRRVPRSLSMPAGVGR